MPLTQEQIDAGLELAKQGGDAATHGKVSQTVDKGKQVLADAGAGATLGATIGSFWPGPGTVIGGAVGTVAGAVYGVVDQFGGDIADFVGGIFGGGPDPVCLDFFRKPGSCDNIDRRMNNVVQMQRDVRAGAPESFNISPADAAKKWNVEQPYAEQLLANERKRFGDLDGNEKQLDHFVHANPRWILGLDKGLGGPKLGTVDALVSAFHVRREFAAQILSAAAKLNKPRPPPPHPPTVTLNIATLTRVAGALKVIAPAAPPPTVQDVTMAHTVVQAAGAGNPEAKATIETVLDHAKAGNPAAIGAATLLTDAQRVQRIARYVFTYTGRTYHGD